MAQSTLLYAAQEVMALASMQVPTSISQSYIPELGQLRAIANQEGNDLFLRHNWTELQKSHSFIVTAASGIQPDSKPADFGRMIDGTMFGSNSTYPIDGPRSPAFFATIAAHHIHPIFNSKWRFRGNGIETTTMPVGTVVKYDYVSKNWAKSVNPTTNPSAPIVDVSSDTLVNDNDSFIYPAQLMIQGMLWRFKKMKGVEYGEDFNTYERTLARYAAADGGMQMITGPQASWLDIDGYLPYNIPIVPTNPY